MESDYRNTRAELLTAVDAVGRIQLERLNDAWWKLSDGIKLIGQMIEDCREDWALVRSLILEVQDQQLPLEDQTQEQHH